ARCGPGRSTRWARREYRIDIRRDWISVDIHDRSAWRRAGGDRRGGGIAIIPKVKIPEDAVARAGRQGGRSHVGARTDFCAVVNRIKESLVFDDRAAIRNRVLVT